MPRGIRFSPPGVPVTDEVRWVLLRAFGPGNHAWEQGLDPELAVESARTLDLLPRVAARTSRELIGSELGAAGLAACNHARTAVVAQSLAQVRAANVVASTAASLGLPAVFLKGAAFHLAELGRPGGRPSGDVDVLAPRDRAEELARELERLGWRSAGPSASAFHLPALFSPAGVPVEIHVEIPGVERPGEDGPLTAESLLAGGLVETAGRSGNALVPVAGVLAAHAMAHGLADHGFAPDAYPPWRWVGDVIDALGRDKGRPAAPDRERVAVPAALSPVEALGALELANRMARADLSVLTEPGSAGTLARHLLAGALDPAYGKALRLRQILWMARARPPRELARKVMLRWEGFGTGLATLAGLVRAEAQVRLRAIRKK